MAAKLPLWARLGLLNVAVAVAVVDLDESGVQALDLTRTHWG